MLKNSEKNVACTFAHSMFVHKFSVKRKIFCVPCEKDKFQCFNMTSHGTFKIKRREDWFYQSLQYSEKENRVLEKYATKRWKMS